MDLREKRAGSLAMRWNVNEDDGLGGDGNLAGVQTRAVRHDGNADQLERK